MDNEALPSSQTFHEYQDDVTAWLISTSCFVKERQNTASSTIGDRTVIPRPMVDSTRASRKLEWETMPLEAVEAAKMTSLRTSVVVADILRRERQEDACVSICDLG